MDEHFYRCSTGSINSTGSTGRYFDTVLELGQLVVVGKSSGTVGEVALLLQTGKASPFLVASRSIGLCNTE